MATQEYKAGEILLAEGVVPERAFRILSGSVELTRLIGDAQTPTNVLDRGALVGADELVDGQPMADTAQALGNLSVEPITIEQAGQMLGRQAKKKAKPDIPPRAEPLKKASTTSESRALVALSSSAETDYAQVDTASTILKPGLLRRLLKPEFADLHDRLDIRVAPLEGPGGEQASAHLVSELNKRRGLRARQMNAKVSIGAGGDPVGAMADLHAAAARWLVDNDGDVLLWGDAPTEERMYIRFFVRGIKPVDSFRIGDGWTLMVLPNPLDAGAAHRLHAAVLAALRTKMAGKLLTVKRDLQVLFEDAPDALSQGFDGMQPLELAEDAMARARIFANATRLKRRAEDARTAINLIDTALNTFSRKETPIEWAMAHRDRALLSQFVAERANDTDSLRASLGDLEAALTVIGPDLFPFDWATLNDRLGLALYRLDFESGDAETLERALRAFQDALTVYDKRQTPAEWAEAMAHFGQVALVIGRENRNPRTLLRAVEACNAVVSVRDRKNMPLHWASAQNNLGSALFLYGRVAGDREALAGARDAFNTAYAIYMEKGAERLAGVTSKNLAHVEKALKRRQTAARPAGSGRASQNWDTEANDPPPLPWEFEVRDAPKQRSTADEDDDDVWLDEHLR